MPYWVDNILTPLKLDAASLDSWQCVDLVTSSTTVVMIVEKEHKIVYTKIQNINTGRRCQLVRLKS
jgi:hypothetical protein